MKFFVYGTPKAQPRPRACVRGRHAAMYDVGTANDWKYSIARAARENRPEMPFTGAVQLQCTFFLERPKKHFLPVSKSRPQPVLRVDAPLWNVSKPDLDNYIKAVMDALSDSGVVWQDDCQVAVINSAKFYEADLSKCGVEISVSDLRKETGV